MGIKLKLKLGTLNHILGTVCSKMLLKHKMKELQNNTNITLYLLDTEDIIIHSDTALRLLRYSHRFSRKRQALDVQHSC